MKSLAQGLFRYFDQVEVARAGGGSGKGRGLVVRLRGDAEAVAEGLSHQLGRLPSPLYVFTGWLEAAPGDLLTQGESAYRVLQAHPLRIGEREVGLRALLEKEEDHGGV